MGEMIKISTNVKGLDELIPKLDPKFASVPARNFLTRGSITIQGKARTNAPKDRGGLTDSIAYEIDPSQPIPKYGRVGTNSAYGPAMEFGRLPGDPMPPPGALIGWMQRHGIPLSDYHEGTEGLGDRMVGESLYFPNEYALARSISEKGTEPHLFLTNAINDSQSSIDRLVTVFASELEAAAAGGG